MQKRVRLSAKPKLERVRLSAKPKNVVDIPCDRRFWMRLVFPGKMERLVYGGITNISTPWRATPGEVSTFEITATAEKVIVGRIGGENSD